MMKNLLTYISPQKSFNEECGVLVKLQIDNSLNLGWKPEDILLVTNFKYQYRQVTATVISDQSYCRLFYPTTKVYAIVEMFRTGLIHPGLYWYHDFDCYQLHPITEAELGMEHHDLGITNYGRMPRLCSASMFFNEKAGDIFEKLKARCDQDRRDEETALMRLLRDDANVQARTKHLNITYAFHRFNLRSCWRIADHPIRAAHFHPTPDKMDFYVQGLNKLQRPLLPQSLSTLFHLYGYV